MLLLPLLRHIYFRPGGVIYGLIRRRAFPVELLADPYIKVCLESIKQMAVRFLSLCLTFAFNPILFVLAAAEIKTDNFQNKSVCVCVHEVCVRVCVRQREKFQGKLHTLKHSDGDDRVPLDTHARTGARTLEENSQQDMGGKTSHCIQRL